MASRQGYRERPDGWRASWIALAGLAGLLAACAAPHPFLVQADANSAWVDYGDDLAAATAVARQHCAAYERTARFLEAENNIAYFACAGR